MGTSRYRKPGAFTFTAAGQSLTDPERGRRRYHQVSIKWTGADANNRVSVQKRQYLNGPLVHVTGSPFAPGGGDTIAEFTGHWYEIVITSSTLGAWAGSADVHYLDYNESDSDPVAQGTLTDISET